MVYQSTPTYLNAIGIRLMWITFIKYKGMVYALGLTFGVKVVSHFRKPQQDNQLPLTRTPLQD
jgi:hypothetical protein